MTGITIVVSWGAVAVFVTLILGFLGTVGGLLWKFVSHTNDSDVHINKHVRIVTKETCDITKNNIEATMNRIEKKNDTLSTKIDETNRLLIQYFSQG